MGATTETIGAPAAPRAARRRIGVGVIGFGWLGQAHSRSLLRIPTLFGDRGFDAELVVCGDPLPERREEAVGSFGFARAVYFGAKVLILDEPTSALGVKQSGVVLRYVAQARDRGLGVIFITHNPHHAYPVGDRFVILNRGRLLGDWRKGEITRDELVKQMSGGAELEALEHELSRQLDVSGA